MVKSLSEKMEDRTIPVTESGCWLWTGHLSDWGYGTLHVGNGKEVKAHRLAWELAYGPIPPKMHVCHRCDVTSCVNPAHLFLGTNADNMRDCLAKGRHMSQKPRKTHCKNGHLLEGDNVRWRDNDRLCVLCLRANVRRYYHRQKAK